VPDVFLTGGSGFIGGALLQRLVAEGRTVAALSRSRDSDRRIASLGGHPVTGDVEDYETLRQAMSGTGVVYHVAGVNRLCLRDPEPMLRANVAGSVNVVRAAADGGVERVVYTSSAAAIGEEEGTAGTESSPHRGRYLTSYERSKHLAEKAVFAEAERLGVDVVAVNPSSVQGPGRATGTAEILIAYLRGRLRWAVDTRLSITYIDDCVEGHLLAENRGEAGERYLLNGATLSVAEALAVVAPYARVGRRIRFVPGWVVAAAGAVVGGMSRVLRRSDPIFCSEMARALLHGHTYDGSRAERELGLTYTPVEEALRRTVEWFRRTGLA
jgi:dihydroflavonol-4-reductase